MTYTSTYVLCAVCDHKLTWKCETAGEPAHYECGGCNGIFGLDGKPFSPAGKLRLPDPGRGD